MVRRGGGGRRRRRRRPATRHRRRGTQRVLLRDLVQHALADRDGPVRDDDDLLRLALARPFAPECLEVAHDLPDQAHLQVREVGRVALVPRALVVLPAARHPAVVRDGARFLLVAPEEVRDDAPVGRVERAAGHQAVCSPSSCGRVFVFLGVGTQGRPPGRRRWKGGPSVATVSGYVRGLRDIQVGGRRLSCRLTHCQLSAI